MEYGPPSRELHSAEALGLDVLAHVLDVRPMVAATSTTVMVSFGHGNSDSSVDAVLWAAMRSALRSLRATVASCGVDSKGRSEASSPALGRGGRATLGVRRDRRGSAKGRRRGPRLVIRELCSVCGNPRLAGISYQATDGTRTRDPFITSEVLYQLSYGGDTRQMVAVGTGVVGVDCKATWLWTVGPNRTDGALPTTRWHAEQR